MLWSPEDRFFFMVARLVKPSAAISSNRGAYCAGGRNKPSSEADTAQRTPEALLAPKKYLDQRDTKAQKLYSYTRSDSLANIPAKA